MRYTQEHAGKWVAARGDKIIASEKTLAKLMHRMAKRRDYKKIAYSLVPKGFMIGGNAIQIL